MKIYSKKIGDFEIAPYHYADTDKNRYVILENGFDCIGEHFSLRQAIVVFNDLTKV